MGEIDIAFIGVLAGAVVGIMMAVVDWALIETKMEFDGEELPGWYHKLKGSLAVVIGGAISWFVDIGFGFATMAACWLAFDLSLNKFREKHWLYLNPEGKSWIDRTFKSGGLLFVVKWVLMVAGGIVSSFLSEPLIF